MTGYPGNPGPPSEGWKLRCQMCGTENGVDIFLGPVVYSFYFGKHLCGRCHGLKEEERARRLEKLKRSYPPTS